MRLKEKTIKRVREQKDTLRYVCVFCQRIFPTFQEVDQHFTEYHKMGSIFTDSLN